MADFRLQAKNLFLTYPQCDLPLCVVKELITKLFGNRLEYGIIAKELHTEEGEHIHAFICLKTPWNIVNSHKLDLHVKQNEEEKTYHGNYQPARSVYNCIKYVCKDGNYDGINCDAKLLLKAAQRKTSTKMAVAASRMIEGESIWEINETDPGLVLSNLKKFQNYKNWLEGIVLLKTPLLPWNSVTTGGATENWIVLIASWLNTNMNQIRLHKQKQLWIVGATNSGKSWLLWELLKYFHGYEIPNDKGWFDGYDDCYDFAYLDEFGGHVTVQWLNSFAEGRHMPIIRRGLRPITKKKNLPLIVCANNDIAGIYHKVDSVVIDALEGRFLQVKIPSGMNIELNFEHDSSDEDTAPLMSDLEEDEYVPWKMTESIRIE